MSQPASIPQLRWVLVAPADKILTPSRHMEHAGDKTFTASRHLENASDKILTAS
jgi:hypothetical protein